MTCSTIGSFWRQMAKSSFLTIIAVYPHTQLLWTALKIVCLTAIHLILLYINYTTNGFELVSIQWPVCDAGDDITSIEM